jgi:signal transduction histidine kinase
MPDGDPSTAAPVDWALRARRLEALCALAAETSGLVEVDPLCSRVCTWVCEVLEADTVAVRTPLLAGDHHRAISGSLPAPALEAALTALLADPTDAPGWHPLPGAGRALRLPLRNGDELLGTLALAWSEPPATRDELLPIAELLAAQTAAALAGVRAYAQLTDAASRRERFFSAMSHDLRTPITAIVGYSELLADGIVGELNAHQQEMVERISQVSGQLSQLVNDILDLARLDAGRMEFHRQELRLGDLVEEALVTVSPQAAAKSLVLRVEAATVADLTVSADAGRVRQILVNLLSNAVKFTDAGEVVVTAGVDSGRSWIEVRDTGPGLPAGAEEEVFEEFLQISAGAKSKVEQGTGLGLAVARRLARAMGGDLTARGGAGSGAAFTLVLPLPEG